MHFLPVLFGIFYGCASPFDGTWLFSIPIEPEQVSDGCYDDEYEYTGTYEMLVDIYTTKGDGIVVLFEEVLRGTVDGNNFTASSILKESTDSYSYLEEIEMKGTLDGSTLSGTIRTLEEDTWKGSTESCEMVYKYDAERCDVDPDDYIGE